MIEVVPPQAAARVPVSKVSEALVPPKGSSMWVCASTPPGMTYLPAASMTVSASMWPRAVDPGESSATMVSPSTRTSAVEVPVALTTVPFLMRVVMGAPWGEVVSTDRSPALAARPPGRVLRWLRCERQRASKPPEPCPRSRSGDAGVGVGPAVAVELPVVAHLPHHVEVEVAHEQLLLVAAAQLADEVAAWIDDLAGAVEVHRLVAVLVVLEPDAVGL